MLAAAGGAFLSIGFLNSFSENMTAGKGFIALAALIFAKWRAWPALATCPLFGLLDAVAIQEAEDAEIWQTLGIDRLLSITALAYLATAAALIIGIRCLFPRDHHTQNPTS